MCTEDYVFNLYKTLSIKSPDQLNINHIANCLNINIMYSNYSFRFGKNIIIKKSSRQIEWQSFGHEVCHYLQHYGNQLNMYYLFRDLQENQANYFAYHFCIPTFMLQELKGVTAHEVMNLFNVEFDFALRRLEMYQNSFYERMNQSVL